MIFSASLPPANAATVLACLDILEADSSIIDQLWENADYMRTGLRRLGYDTGRSNTPIIPLIIRDDIRTALAWRALADSGVYTNPVVPPGVPANNGVQIWYVGPPGGIVPVGVGSAGTGTGTGGGRGGTTGSF